MLFHRGDDSTVAHILLKGLVKMSGLTGDGRELVFRIAGPGTVIGEFGALTRRPRLVGVSCA